MFLVSLLRRIAFSYYDYKAYNFNIEKTDFVVIHIPDQIGDAMAIFPVIRALELHKIKHLLIVTSTIKIPLLLQFMLITKRDGPQWPMFRSQSSLGKKLTI